MARSTSPNLGWVVLSEADRAAAEQRLAASAAEGSGYLRKGYLLRMRGEHSKQVNLISPSEIKTIY